MKTTTMKSSQLIAGFLSLASLVAFGSCDAVQPKPQCKVQPADYAARYTQVGDPEGTCMDPMGAEILKFQYYVPKRGDANDTPSLAVEPASVADLVSSAEEEMKELTEDSEYSQSKFSTIEPDSDNICHASKFKQETHVATADADISYTWEKIDVMVTPFSNGVYLGGTMKRKEGECTFTYKVTAITPAVHCGDGEKQAENEDGTPKVDDMGNPVMEPDPESGNPVQDVCEVFDDKGNLKQGSGLNPDLEYECDAHSLLCLVKQDFPALKK